MISSGKKIGVDAGTSIVKIVEVAKSGDGVGLANWSFMPFRVPPGAPPQALGQAQAKAVDAALKKCGCKCRDIVVGVPGNSAFIRNIKLPPVPASKIDQIVRYEIQQTIPFPIEDIALDYQVLEPDEASEVEVIMVAMKGEMAENFINEIEQANVNVGIVDSIPLALYNCYRFNGYSSKDECTAIMEIGASSSNILIELDGELRYCRSVGIGGNDITAAIAKELNIPIPQAERIKTQHGVIFPESQEENFSPDVVRVSKAVSGVLSRLLSEIKLTLGYFRSLTGATAISRVVLAGGGAMLKNIRPYLGEHLGVRAEIINPFRKVEVPKNLANARKIAPMLATAVGLALRSSADCCQLKVSLIPPKVKQAKSRRVRVICNSISLAIFVVTIALYVWSMMPEQNYLDARLEELKIEVAKYEKHEGTLNKLKDRKSTLLSENLMYSRFLTQAVNVVSPMAVLSDSVKGSVWVKSVEIARGGAVTVDGAIRDTSGSGSRVEGLRQLSDFRKRLGKYCGAVAVKKQEQKKTELSFSMQLSKFSGIKKFKKIQAQIEAEAEKARADAKNKETEAEEPKGAEKTQEQS